MSDWMLLLPILIPLVAGVLVLPMRRAPGGLREGLAVLAALANAVLAAWLFAQVFPRGDVSYSIPWTAFGWDLSLRLYTFSGFIVLASAAFGLLVTLYSWRFMQGRAVANQFYCYLLVTLAFVNGAVLADHLVVLLFFWEGLLAVLFGMIAIGSPGAFRTATKMFIIVGVTDVCLLIGIALTGWLAKDAHIAFPLSLSAIGAAKGLSTAGLGGLAAVLLLIGAVSKAGSMPFHSWIPDAAVDAPLPFMALLPASLEKLLGIYFLARIVLDLFPFTGDSWMSPLLMIVGAVTILLAVAMALVQKDFKRLLSYHAISQVGYMILGIGTATAVGIVGGLFHMLNNAMYKSCLFLTAGSVEKQAGTTDLNKLGGLGAKMPITFACFFVAAISISGFPLTNGFFSKELVYAGALDRHWVFYAVAILGTALTAASFLKLGHAAFLGKRNPEHDGVKEAPLSMLVPMIVIAAGCLLFGLYNALPLRGLIQPSVSAEWLKGHDFAGFHFETFLVAMTIVALSLAVLNHLLGAKKTGSGLHAVDHIHHAPVLATIYDKAEKRWFDPYDIGLAGVSVVSRLGWWADRFIDWLYDGLAVGVTYLLAGIVRLLHTGSYALYVLWALAGAMAVMYFLVR